MKYIIKTYGCQFNYSDSERVSAVLEDLGFSKAKNETDANLILFNTCSVRQKAENRVFGLMPLMDELKKRKRNIFVGITGCMVRRTSTKKSRKQDKLVREVPAVDFVFRIEDTAALPQILKDAGMKISKDKIKKWRNIDSDFVIGSLKNYFKINPKYQSRFQAFVPIATGCDKFCAYCIVPFSRGREKSRPMEDILSECEKLVDGGCKEITLLGQNVDSYGLSFSDREEGRFKPLKKGEKIHFTRLLEKLDKLKSRGLVRVRWTSPHPKDMTDDLINAAATLATQMPYIHLPLQAGSDEMLKKMNRPYTCEKYVELVEKIRKAIPDCAISTDIIVGFCGETKEMFNKTAKLFKKLNFDMAYLSQYSQRPFTAAARTMKDDVSRAEKERRWHKLNDILTKSSLSKHKTFEGKIVNVLVERFLKGGICEGRSEHFKRTQFPVKNTSEGKKLIGRIVPVKVEKGHEWHLEGAISPKR